MSTPVPELAEWAKDLLHEISHERADEEAKEAAQPVYQDAYDDAYRDAYEQQRKDVLEELEAEHGDGLYRDDPDPIAAAG